MQVSCEPMYWLAARLVLSVLAPSSRDCSAGHARMFMSGQSWEVWVKPSSEPPCLCLASREFGGGSVGGPTYCPPGLIGGCDIRRLSDVLDLPGLGVSPY